jgi:O-antigen ligase
MPGVQSRSAISRSAPTLDLPHLVFLLGVFIAPFHLRFWAANFTLFDVALLAAALLLPQSLRRLYFLPMGFTAVVYIFLVFALLSTFRASQPIESLTQILQFAFIFFIQLPVVMTLGRPQLLVRLSVILLLLARLIVVTGALLFDRMSASDRALSFEGDSANQFAYPTAYLLPFVLYFVLDTCRRRHSMAAGVLAFPVLYLMLWALAASGSRSATLATLVSAIVFLAFRRGYELSARTLVRFSVAAAAVGYLGYWLHESDYFPSTLRHRLALTLRWDESLMEDRVELAVAGLRAFLESPLIGVGLDNFRYVAHEYGVFATATDPHNMWIDLLAKVGLVGTAAFVVLIAGWFVLLLRAQHASDDPSEREIIGAFIASMVAIMTIHMFVPMMLQRQYWLLYGLGLALASDVSDGRTRRTRLVTATTRGGRYGP